MASFKHMGMVSSEFYIKLKYLSKSKANGDLFQTNVCCQQTCTPSTVKGGLSGRRNLIIEKLGSSKSNAKIDEAYLYNAV